jgi:hypothetical protein
MEKGNSFISSQKKKTQGKSIKCFKILSQKILNSGRLCNRGVIANTLIFSKTRIVLFTGQKVVENMFVSTPHSYDKNGKWSYSTYTVTLNEGVETTDIATIPYTGGHYCKDISSLAAMSKELGIESTTPAAQKKFFQEVLPKEWARHLEYLQKLDTLYAEGVEDTVRIEFFGDYRNRRCGNLHLLLNGEVYHHLHNPMPELVVLESMDRVPGYGGGHENYTIVVPADTLVEELYEGNYGGDALDTRGYVYNRDTQRWKQQDGSEGNTPFADLLKGL